MSMIWRSLRLRLRCPSFFISNAAKAATCCKNSITGGFCQEVSPPCITPLQILRSARRFCRNPSPVGASDRSPVREHWERRERQASPGTGRKNWSRVLLSPRAGAGKFAIRTQGSRAGLFSCALRASQTFYCLRLCRFVGRPILAAAAFRRLSCRMTVHLFLWTPPWRVCEIYANPCSPPPIHLHVAHP